jgi:hypothetical protein
MHVEHGMPLDALLVSRREPHQNVPVFLEILRVKLLETVELAF